MWLIPDKAHPLIVNLRVDAQHLITGKHKDLVTRRLLQRVVVELYVPHAGRGIEGFASLRGVDEALFRSGVRAHERSEVVRGETFALEQRDEVICGVVHVGEFACGSRPCGVFAANPGADAGALGAGDGGVVVGVLREVGVADFELGLYFAEDEADGLEAVVLWAVDLAKVHHQRAVGAPASGVFVPGAGVVEAEADGGAGVIVALAVAFFEALGEFGGDVIPWVEVLVVDCRGAADDTHRHSTCQRSTSISLAYLICPHLPLQS